MDVVTWWCSSMALMRVYDCPQVTKEFADKLASLACVPRPTKSPYWQGEEENRAPLIGNKGKRKRADSSAGSRSSCKKPALGNREDSGDEFEPPSQSSVGVRRPGLLPAPIPMRRGHSL